MLPIAYYLLKAIICSGILYGYYWLLLRNKIFHKYNRFYLMVSVVLSLLLPLIKINFWQQNDMAPTGVIQVLQAVSNSDEYMDTIILTKKSSHFNTAQLYPFAYLLVSLIFFLVFIHGLYTIFILLKKCPRQIIGTISFVNTDAKNAPFSFLRYIFWNNNIDIKTTTGQQIFKHELAHVQQKHSHDKLFINIILIFFWCNPFYWLIRKELNMIHEFIADKKAVEDSGTGAFAAMILQATYPQHRFQLTNNFFYSPIKRRLLMLTKNKNPKVNYFGRIMVLPLLVLIFAAFTFKIKAGLQAGASRYNGKKITVVIDAGHGGKDLGAKSADNILEKDIALAICKKVKELNNNEAVEIILTREDDLFMSPKEKAAFAKEKNADIFISVHMAGTAQTTEKSGSSFYVAQNEFANTGKSKILAAALIDAFGKNYALPVNPAPVQSEKGTWVLQANDIPSVLFEAGYITNETDARYLQTGAARETIAKNVLAAINKFRTANLQGAAIADNNILGTTNFKSSIYINTKHADTNYFKTDAFKNRALVFVDGKEIGNVGMNYVEKSNAHYNSLVTYNPEEAKKLYGEKGKYGVIKLTIKDVVSIIADSVFVDAKNNSINIPGHKAVIKGDLSNTLIYIDGKISTPAALEAIPASKISSVNILKGDKLDDIIEAKGKTAIINVQLKPGDLPGVITTSKIQSPLYIINGKECTEENLDKIDIGQVDDIRVIKENTALQVYGEKGKDGVVIINLKPGTSRPYTNKMIATGDISKLGTKPYVEVDGKKYAGNSLPEFMKESGIEHFELITVYNKEDAVKKFGAKASDGAIIAATKKTNNNAAPEVAIALDKMNMLYIGVDNPVSLAVSGYKTEDLIVSMQNGTITGKDGKYIARVSNTNPAEIIIETIENGKRKLLGKQTYRVKRVPEPVDKIAYSDFDYTINPKLGIDGNSKVHLKTDDFLKAKKITAGTGYEVTEATVYFSGAGFPKVKYLSLNGNELIKLKENLDNCVAGSIISFDNVRVKGDNGYYATVDGISIQLY
jgi:N-acetylmuramoyl-L-alanine amidase